VVESRSQTGYSPVHYGLERIRIRFAKSLEGKVFNFNVEPIDYVDFIGIDAILSDYSSKNCDEIHMVKNAFLSIILLVRDFGLLFLLGSVILVYVNLFYALTSKPKNTGLDPLEKRFIIIIEFV
jgi:hypothetical protein